MKEVVLERRLQGISVQHYYDVVYGGGDLMRRFHAEVSKDSDAQVSDWVDGVRSISFNMPVNVPLVMKRMIGLDVIAVIETMTLAWIDSSSFTVSSTPTLDFVGSKKFMTTGIIVVSALPGAKGCQVKCTLQCTAAMPWPMQSSIEAMMATEGSESIEKFLRICEEGCRDTPPLPGSAAPAAAPASSSSYVPPRRGAHASSSSSQYGHHSSSGTHHDDLGNEDFYDAADSSFQDEEYCTAIVPARRLEDTILLCLQHIERSTSQSAQSLSMLERTMSSVDVHMQAIHDAVVPKPIVIKPLTTYEMFMQIATPVGFVATLAVYVYYTQKQRY